MTEAEWLACADSGRMLGFLRREVVTIVDEPLNFDEQERMRLHVACLLAHQKFRLLACACSRMVWGLLTDEGRREAVEGVERRSGRRAAGGSDADGASAPYDPAVPILHARTGDFAEPAKLAARYAARAAWTTARPDVRWHDVQEVIDDSAMAAAWAGVFPSWAETRRWQCILIRDIFGTPFRPVSIDPSWLTPPVTTLAQTIYDDRAFGRMPELADALETAGCYDPEVLAHCRSGGEHVRGCWVVDLLLGKA